MDPDDILDNLLVLARSILSQAEEGQVRVQTAVLLARKLFALDALMRGGSPPPARWTPNEKEEG